MKRSVGAWIGALCLGASACGAPATAPRPSQAPSSSGGDAARASSYAAAVSAPREDSLFPQVGDPSVDALHYDLQLDWTRARRLVGRETLALRVARTGPAFQLDLEAALHPTSVTLDGKPVPFTHPGKDLVVHAPVKAGERHTLTLTYRGRPRAVVVPTDRRDIQELGWKTTPEGGAFALQEPYGAYSWYAVNDQPSDKAFYDVTLNVPAPMVGVSNGQLVARSTTGGVTTTRWRLGSPAASYLVTVAIGRYRSVSDTGPGGLAITYWIPAHPLAPLTSPQILASARKTPEALTFLEGKLGPYPYPSLGVVYMPSDSAMETQSTLSIGETSYALSEDVLVHELAHQWYGDQVTPSDWSDLWMSEGMAFYLAEATWTAQEQGTTPGQAILPWAERARGEWAAFGPPGHSISGAYGDLNAYVYPGMMWDLIRRRLGDDLFWKLVREWPATHAGTSQTLASMTTWWSARAGQDLGSVFHDWLLGPTQPAWSPAPS